ncbi:MAG: type IV secretory system conjugative DNA transfer family protein [Candidatus Melainabacteria bacterium]|nr:type IV secretory system conjugative DNA transfer family protein [Candidatus Melainabacteria bacterium]
MTYRQQTDERGNIVQYKDIDTGEVISAKEYQRIMQMQQGLPQAHGQLMAPPQGQEQMIPLPQAAQPYGAQSHYAAPQGYAAPQAYGAPQAYAPPQAYAAPQGYAQPSPYAAPQGYAAPAGSPLAHPGAQYLSPQGPSNPGATPVPRSQTASTDPGHGGPPTQGIQKQGKSLRMEGIVKAHPQAHAPMGKRAHGFLDATSVAILLPTLVLLALIIAAAHKKRLFPWQTIRTFNPPSGMLTPRDYERSYLCPPNLRRHGRMGKRNPNATWTDEDGVVIPFGFLARTHLPITIPMGRLPNKNMFIVAPSGSGKTTLMRAIIKSLLAKPCVIIALEAKANDPNLDEKKEGFKYTVLPEAQHAGFNTLYFNPLDQESIHWNPLDLPAITFATSIVQDINSLDAEEQHWAERDMGYIEGLAQLLHWGAVQVVGEDENGSASELEPLPCNPRGLMKLVNNRRNIVESLRQLKSRPDINAAELSELTQRLSSIIRTDQDWDKNIQGVRGRLRMFKNEGILRVTEKSDIALSACMHQPTVLIFGAPASLGPDAESLAATFVYQLQQALHTRYGTKSVLPLFAFFDEYQTLNIDLAGRLSAIVRGANGGLTVILQNISQIASGSGAAAESELRTIFSNSAIRVCLHNADEYTAQFFSEEIGKHAVIVPGIADHYQATGFGIFPTSWNRIHSQQVVARVDPDGIKRMEKHHALVYLAPAGDPEFGETKPFMVDLRGIEEIARLHLLHNVNSRTGPEGSQAVSERGFAQVMHPADAINQAFSAPSQELVRATGAETGAQMEVSGALVENQYAPHAEEEPSLPPGQPFASRGALPGFAGAGAVASGSMGSGAMGGLPARPGMNAMAQAAASMPSHAAAPVSSSAPAASLSQPASASVSAGPLAPAGGGSRACPHCGQMAGKGKFCIECGKFIGAADSQPAQASQAISPHNLNPGVVGPMGSRPAGSLPQPRYGGLEVTNRDTIPQKRTESASGGPLSQRVAESEAVAAAAAENQRTAVTSLNPDISRFGFANQYQQGAQRKPGGVEF